GGARILAEALSEAGEGVSVLTGGTDVHLVLVDLQNSSLDGQQAEDRLHDIGITVNRNAIPFDPRPPMVTSGLRIGTPALATRGLGEEDFAEIGQILTQALTAKDFGAAQSDLAARVANIAERHPLYADLS
ncbi:MAG: serine hydroxymethyltransferase, partial [Solirubrobacterales bacterium]|nr:serine hydroxymethyltransferase [Solirubrobacterales bacterium]